MPTYDIIAIRRQTLRSKAMIRIGADNPRQAAEQANAIPVAEIEWADFDSDSGPETYHWTVDGAENGGEFETDENGLLHDC
jgi:hypothetical protein